MPDIVITVCGNVATETCPVYLCSIMHTHWGVADPVKATGTKEGINAAFNQAYRILRQGTKIFLSLPLDHLSQNSSAFKTKLDCIGNLKFKQKYTALAIGKNESLIC